jgi:hypothetical protein
LTARSSNSVALCLAGFARLAFAQGDPERAAMLAGATEGLRQRVGLRAWPMLRQSEAELLARVGQALGADRFGEIFAAGARLSRHEAMAAAADQPGAYPRAP